MMGRVPGQRRVKSGWATAVAVALAALLCAEVRALAAPPIAPPFPGPLMFAQGRNFGAGDVAAVLRSQGFRDISNVTQRGNTFIAEATSATGERMQLVISQGNVIGARVIGRPGRR